MKRNTCFALALIALSTLAFSTNPAWAHRGNHDGMWQQQGATQLTPEQQTAVQKAQENYYTQTSDLRQQLMSKRYEYNTLLAASTPDSAKIESVAKEIASLNQALDEQRVQLDLALAQAGVPRGVGMGYGCGGYRHGGGHMGNYGGGHMGMGHW